MSATEESSTGPVPHLVVELDQPAAVDIVYSGSAGSALLVSSASASTTHRLALTRLAPAASHVFSVRTASDTVSGTVKTPPLPPDLGEVRLSGTGTPSQPLFLLEMNHPDGFSGFVIVDGEGTVFWYFRTAGAATGATRRANGNFVFVDLGAGLLEVSPGGEVVSTLSLDDGHRPHHDVLETEAHTLLFLAHDPREHNGQVIGGDAIWEWSPETGELARRWSSWDAFSPDTDWGERSSVGDWVHANSLAIGAHGNVVVSLNFLNQVVSLTPDMSDVEWRLGGVHATITVPEEERFSGQHTAAEPVSGRVLMFDNGWERPLPYSRAVEFELVGGEARKAWEFRPASDNWSRAISSARRLLDGGTLVTFGLSAGVAGSTGPIEVYDVSPDGTVRWHLGFEGAVRSVYRASPLQAVGREREVGAAYLR